MPLSIPLSTAYFPLFFSCLKGNSGLQQLYACIEESLLCFFRPEGGLDFSDMGLAQEEHAYAGLTDSAADR